MPCGQMGAQQAGAATEIARERPGLAGEAHAVMAAFPSDPRASRTVGSPERLSDCRWDQYSPAARRAALLEVPSDKVSGDCLVL